MTDSPDRYAYGTSLKDEWNSPEIVSDSNATPAGRFLSAYDDHAFELKAQLEGYNLNVMRAEHHDRASGSDYTVDVSTTGTIPEWVAKKAWRRALVDIDDEYTGSARTVADDLGWDDIY